MTRTLIALAILTVVGGALLASLHGRGPQTPVGTPAWLRIVATNDVRARDRRCGCEGNRLSQETVFVQACSCQKHASQLTFPALGGLPERSAWLAKLGPHLSVDAGDLLFRSLFPSEPERDDWARRARLMVEGYGILGIDAYTPGEMDLALGRDFFEETLKGAHFPVVCSNLVDAATRARLFPGSTTVTVPGTSFRVGIVGLFDPPPDVVVLDKITECKLALLDPVTAVRAEVEALHRDKVDFVVLLAHAPDPRTRVVLRQVEGIDAAFCAHAEFLPEKPGNAEGTTALTRAFPGGGTPNVANFQLAPGGKGVLDYMDPAAHLLRRARARVDAATLARAKATNPADVPKLDAELEQARLGVTAVETAQGGPRHVLTLMPTPLFADDLKTGQDPRLLAAIERFKADSVGASLSADAVARLEAAGKDEQGRPLAFRTVQQCRTCHAKQNEVWSKSEHANAWASLERAGNQQDPECVRCHSIGLRAPGGFASVSRATHVREGSTGAFDFRNVQCEACHGPRAAHPEAKGVGVHLPGIQTCMTCHDPDHDPTFNLARFTKALTDHKVCLRN